ncbi:MAG: hypothetical protein DSY90_03300 [Deltaproteobacteria bacterium]|nr:MAG: hypothetical protein DSY90_03300 [Deltaproteobacteria bacterium]
MIFTISLYLALGICVAGILFRTQRWVTLRIGPETDTLTVGARITAATGQTIRALVSRRVFKLIGIFITDVLLQLNILHQSFWRWIMHICLFYGMILLILMHALDDPLTRTFFPDYESTLNPFLWLRDLFGLMVLAGAGIAMIRRVAGHRLRQMTRAMDTFTLFFIGMVIVSGMMLEAVQIVSEPIFNEMVDEYLDEDDEEILAPLRAYWASQYGVVFENPVDTDDPAVLAEGYETHDEYCISCHSRPVSAFMSYPVARFIRPVARRFNRIRMDTWLWYIHFLSAFAALAWLPFGKFFHLIATPVNLLICGSRTTDTVSPAQLANRRALGLDACTHCGICSLHCKVAPIQLLIDNITILPSEKLAGFARHVRHRHGSEAEAALLAEGSFICTDCGRCTEVCPSGIDLKDIWQASKQDLRRQGFTEAHHWIMKKPAHEWAHLASERSVASGPSFKKTFPAIHLTDRPETFRGCIQCTICTTVCPVVEAADDPARELDLTPQQIMNLLRLQMADDALGARMVWNCVTCYMCQEHCPQGVRVADVLYELRNIAYRRFYPDTVHHLDSQSISHRPKEEAPEAAP